MFFLGLGRGRHVTSQIISDSHLFEGLAWMICLFGLSTQRRSSALSGDFRVGSEARVFEVDALDISVSVFLVLVVSWWYFFASARLRPGAFKSTARVV